MNKLLLGMVLTMAFLMGLSFYSNNSNTGFVNNAQLFEQFAGKKELQRKLDAYASHRKATIDSVRLNLMALRDGFLAAPNNENSVRLYKEQELRFRQMEQVFEEEFEVKSQEYTTEIWKQINQYLLEFGQENGYDFIHGASGSGALMYANEQLDLTDAVLNYINLKYEGH